MRPILAILVLLFGAVPAWADPAPGADRPSVAITGGAVGQALPDIALDQPGRELRLSGLPGRWLLVESFSMYCPHCQAAAGDVNELSRLLALRAADLDAVGGATLVGLGADNSRYEVDYFQKHYAVPFALYPDLDMTFYNALGAPGTPSFALVEKTGQGLVLRALHAGPFERPAELLDEWLGLMGAPGASPGPGEVTP